MRDSLSVPRETVVGLGAGILPGGFLAAMLGLPAAVVAGLVVGVGYSVAFRASEGTPVDHAVSGGALGVPV